MKGLIGLIVSILLVIVICAILAESGCPSSVTGHPQQVVGYAGERVSYECTICEGTLYWKVNGMSLYHFLGEPYYLDEIEGNPGILSIIALPSLNNTIVQCIAHSQGTNVYSDPVPILVQGKLSAPTNLTSEVNDHNVSLSWTPPYTMPNTSMTFVITASVIGQSNPLRTTTSSPSYTLSLSNPNLHISRDSNHTIEFTVCADNRAGEGENTSIIVTIPAQNGNSSEQAGIFYVTVSIAAVIFPLLVVLFIACCYLLNRISKANKTHCYNTEDSVFIVIEPPPMRDVTIYPTKLAVKYKTHKDA